MRNPKAWLPPIVTTGVFLCFDGTRVLGVGCLFILVVILVEARHDAKDRFGYEASVRAMAARTEAVLAEAEDLRRQAADQVARARAVREEALRQLQEFANRELSQVRPSPEELWDGLMLEASIEFGLEEAENFANGESL